MTLALQEDMNPTVTIPRILRRQDAHCCKNRGITLAGNGGADIYKVQNIISPNANTAVVRYTIGSKICVFGTTYLASLSGVPQWTKTATPNGGATCTANITSINAVDNSWNVEFTMK